ELGAALVLLGAGGGAEGVHLCFVGLLLLVFGRGRVGAGPVLLATGRGLVFGGAGAGGVGGAAPGVIGLLCRGLVGASARQLGRGRAGVVPVRAVLFLGLRCVDHVDLGGFILREQAAAIGHHRDLGRAVHDEHLRRALADVVGLVADVELGVRAQIVRVADVRALRHRDLLVAGPRAGGD